MSIQDLKNKFEELKKKFLEKKFDEVIEECNLVLKKNKIDVFYNLLCLSYNNKNNIAKINQLYEDGNKIVYWTARGSRTGIDWFDLTEKQLLEWSAKYHELKCNKPYYDIFIEDKSLRIEEL